MRLIASVPYTVSLMLAIAADRLLKAALLPYTILPTSLFFKLVSHSSFDAVAVIFTQ